MSKREEYNACMRPYMAGSKPKEQRKLDFCIGAKLCSGKAKTPEEAKVICSQPKPLKEPKVRTAKKDQSCEKSAQKVAECVVSKLVSNDVYKDQALNINSAGAAITNALIECQCQK